MTETVELTELLWRKLTPQIRTPVSLYSKGLYFLFHKVVDRGYFVVSVRLVPYGHGVYE